MPRREYDKERVLQCAFLYFFPQRVGDNYRYLSQEEIAERLGMNQAMVSRYIGRARSFIKISFEVPPEEELAKRLCYKYDLFDAKVHKIGGDESAPGILGISAAQYFEKECRSGYGVGLSCGHTLLSMVQAVKPVELPNLKITQLSVEFDPHSIHQAPATLVGLLHAKFREQNSDVFGASFLSPCLTEPVQTGDIHEKQPEIEELRRRISPEALNLLFVGIGVMDMNDRDSSFVAIIKKAFGVTPEKPDRLTYLASEISRLRLVGEINNQPYDENGVSQLSFMSELRGKIVPIMSLLQLKEFAEKRHIRVVAVAGGAAKRQAIKAALRGRLFNVLITDAKTAEFLLADK